MPMSHGGVSLIRIYCYRHIVNKHCLYSSCSWHCLRVFVQHRNKQFFISQWIALLHVPMVYVCPITHVAVLRGLMDTGVTNKVYTCAWLWREKEIHRKIVDPAGVQTQDLLISSQMLIPLGHRTPVQRSRRLTICSSTIWKSSWILDFYVEFFPSPKHCICSKPAKNSLLEGIYTCLLH